MAQKIQFVVVYYINQNCWFWRTFSGFDPVNANIIKDEILVARRGSHYNIFYASNGKCRRIVWPYSIDTNQINW
jgi:ABC-type uncharacterized transport system ATPase subunit